MSNQQFLAQNSKGLDDTGSLYQSKQSANHSMKSPFVQQQSATQSSLNNTSNLKGKLSSLEVSPIRQCH